MLIDDLLNNQSWEKAGVIKSLRGRLAKAPKFVLRRDFAMAVDELVHNNWEVDRDKIVPLCRIPYPECWIELAQVDRLSDRIRPVIGRTKVQFAQPSSLTDAHRDAIVPPMADLDGLR
jgi:hypothetical protein